MNDELAKQLQELMQLDMMAQPSTPPQTAGYGTTASPIPQPEVTPLLPNS